MTVSSGPVQEVSICFQDGAINEIFSELLSARGIVTRIVDDLGAVSESQKVITEPRFLGNLDRRLHPHCLVVRYRDTELPQSVLTLSQPLTEQKIESALAKLLTRP